MQRRLSSWISALAIAALVAVAGTAYAQPRAAGLADRVAALEKEIASLKEAAVQVPTVSESVQQLSQELATVTQRLDTLEHGQQSIPDAVKVLDDLSGRVRALEQAVAGVRADVAAIGAPEVSGGGGGVTYDKGFGWTTSDGRYGLTLDGYMQARYQGQVEASDVTESTLRIRRGRIGAKGTLATPKLKFRLLYELLAQRSMLDYYVNYALMGKRLGLRFGQYKVQMTRNYLTSSTKLLFPERSTPLEKLRYDRDVQLGLHGESWHGRVGYYLGIGNGAGPNQVNSNIDFAETLRMDFAVLGDRLKYGYGDLGRSEEPRLTVGAGVIHDLSAVPDQISGTDFVTDVDANGTRDNVRVITTSADALFHYRGVELSLEWLWRHEDWGSILAGQSPALTDVVGTERSHDYHYVAGHAAYAILPDKLIAAARASWAHMPFFGVDGRSSGLPTGKRLLELDGSLQLFAAGHRWVGLEYSFFDYSDLIGSGEARHHRAILEAQLKF